MELVLELGTQSLGSADVTWLYRGVPSCYGG